MKLSSLILPLAALVLAAPAVHAETSKSQSEARQDVSIPFVNHGGIRDWRSAGDNVVYIQGSNRDWYKATLFSPSPDLPFAQTIGFDTGPTDTLDKFSTIVIRGQRYPIASLEKIAGEPPKKGKMEQEDG